VTLSGQQLIIGDRSLNHPAVNSSCLKPNMTKIISRKSLGIKYVYDIGVEKDHNFLLANGLIASNCFNKSHSTAYAYVTYQTAYLKANYPVEYMSALLSASSDNKEKIEKYRENCQRMGIEVEPPDVNRSHTDFTPVDKKILFGLSAVPTVGQGAIENILKAREEAEGFESLADFCEKVDLRVVNRRALETLIHCGAFDRLQNNRKQLIADLELVITWAQNRAKEKESGQMNLFDLMGGDDSESKEDKNGFEQTPSAPPVADYSIQERLKIEKETLGFYVSDHPLKSINAAAQILSPVNLSQLNEEKSRKKISAVVMLTSVKKHVTKTGKPMAFIKMEDVSGEVEGVVFTDAYEQLEKVLQEDARLIVWGKVDKRDDRLQLIVDDAEPVEDVRMAIIRMTSQQALDPASQNLLKGILQQYSGDKNKVKVPVVAVVGFGDRLSFVRFGDKFWVQDCDRAVQALNNAGFLADAEHLIPNIK
jgi:DNA polymerase III subunit alpha